MSVARAGAKRKGAAKRKSARRPAAKKKRPTQKKGTGTSTKSKQSTPALETAASPVQDLVTSVAEGSTRYGGGSPRRLTATEAMDRELARSALEKRRRKVKPTREEKSALRRIEKVEGARQRWESYENCPQKDYRAMTGRQTKVLQDQARTWGIPCDGPVISLPKVLLAFHDFLAKHSRVLSAAEGMGEDDASGSAVSSPALEKYRHERYLLARLDRLEQERSLLPREDVHQGLAYVASFYRSMQEKVERSFGREVADMMEEDLAEAESAMEAWFGLASEEPSDDG